MVKMTEQDAIRDTLPGRRICVVGTSGSGKTYVAEALARILGIPYVCNDAIIWRANWQETPADERYAELDAATSGPAWTFDGNLNPESVNPDRLSDDLLILSRCDTIVWLDLPRWQVWSSIARRTLWRAWTKEPFWHGNVERWRTVFSRDSMILWSIKTYARRRRVYGALFADEAYSDRIRIRLRSRREVNGWLTALATKEHGRTRS
jgi:adenylate kinase family enzyme